MRVPLRGVQFHGAWFVHELELGCRLTLEREPNNPKDRNAIMVLHEGRHLGYVGKEKAARLAPAMDAGAEYEVSLRGLWQVAYAKTNGSLEVTPVRCLV